MGYEMGSGGSGRDRKRIRQKEETGESRKRTGERGRKGKQQEKIRKRVSQKPQKGD